MSILDIFIVQDSFLLSSFLHSHLIIDRAQRVMDLQNYSIRFFSCHVAKRQSYVD